MTTQIQQIEKNFNAAVAEYADKNLAQWVLDLLSDNGPAAHRGPMRDKVTCYNYAATQPHIMALWKGQ